MAVATKPSVWSPSWANAGLETAKAAPRIILDVFMKMSFVMVAQIKRMGYSSQQALDEYSGIDSISCIYLMISTPTLVQLKRADSDRCRAAMFADKVVRERLLLLYAFHYELAKVPELVSEPMIGAIRYQWWRDAIAEIYESRPVRQHEITTPLARFITECNLPRFWLDKLIDARERDLDPRPFIDLNEAQDYCRQTSGALMQIAMKVTGQDPNNAVMSAGEAWGLTGLARAYRYYQSGMLRQLSYQAICDAAKDAYDASGQLRKLDSDTFPATVYAALIPGYLSRLTDSGHDPATMSVSYAPLRKRLRLIGAVMRGRI